MDSHRVKKLDGIRVHVGGETHQILSQWIGFIDDSLHTLRHGHTRQHDREVCQSRAE